MTPYLWHFQGVSKGGSKDAVRSLKKLGCCPFWPSGESEDHTEGPQPLLCLLSCRHKKERPPAGSKQCVLLERVNNTHNCFILIAIGFFEGAVSPTSPLVQSRDTRPRVSGDFALQNHIADRQLSNISLWKIQKCKHFWRTFSLSTLEP